MENVEKNVLVLEVNGKKKIMDYQKTLYEAAVLGISHVMFVIVLDGCKKHAENINDMKKSLYKSCNVLGITPVNINVTVCGSFIGTSVGVLNKNGHVKLSDDMPKFANYKRRKENRDKILVSEGFEKVYQKKLQVI